MLVSPGYPPVMRVDQSETFYRNLNVTIDIWNQGLHLEEKLSQVKASHFQSSIYTVLCVLFIFSHTKSSFFINTATKQRLMEEAHSFQIPDQYLRDTDTDGQQPGGGHPGHRWIMVGLSYTAETWLVFVKKVRTFVSSVCLYFRSVSMCCLLNSSKVKC